MPTTATATTTVSANLFSNIVTVDQTPEQVTVAVMAAMKFSADKFTDDSPEVDTDAARIAVTNYARNYSGSNGFMQAMCEKASNHTFNPSVAMVRGILNIMRADAKKPVTVNTKMTTTPTAIDFNSVNVPHAVQPGTYSVVLGSVHDYVTIEISTAEEFIAKTSFPKGTLVAAYLAGADNDGDYIPFAFVTPDGAAIVYKRYRDTHPRQAQALKILANGTKDEQIAHGMAYAMQAGVCWRCGRTLTVPTSIGRGLGPICYQKIVGETLDGSWED